MADEQGTARSKTAPALVKATAPLAKHLAGRRWFPAWAQLTHRGRRSGKEYVIPVAVLVKPGLFVIGLPWGPKTNWVQNVLAAGGCTIRWKGVNYRATEPQLVDTQVALQAASRLQASTITRIGFPAFMQLKR